MSDNIKDLKETEREWREATDKSERCGPGMAWVPGVVLIGLGAFFLLNNFTDFHLDNWWALFFLIPAFGSLGNFARAYGKEGRLTGEARGSFIGGLIFLFIAAAFLFNLSWGIIWPVFLIIAGLGALLAGLFG